MDILKQYLNLPKSCYVNSKLHKRVFTDNPEFTLKKDEKEILKNYIDSMYFEYTLKPQILNIPRYEDEEVRYEEIEIIKVKITEKAKEDKVCNMIQKYIPYPIVIMIEYNEFIKFNLAVKKINKVEKEKLAIEEMIYTEWINLNELTEKDQDFLNSLDINTISINNIFEIYEGFRNRINSYNLSKYRQEFVVKSVEDTVDDMIILQRIDKTESEITSLRNQLKKESNMGAKVELNVKIKKLQKEIQKLRMNLI